MRTVAPRQTNERHNRLTRFGHVPCDGAGVLIPWGYAVDRRRIEMQIRAVIVPYRIEARRRDSLTLLEFRKRAISILATLEDAASSHPDLAARLSAARHELDPPGEERAEEASVG
jgi:hypothetical protein